MKNYESTLLSAKNLSEVAIRRGLGIGIGGELTSWHPGPANLAPIECSKVCSVISAYRLLDVVAMLGGVHGARPSTNQDSSSEKQTRGENCCSEDGKLNGLEAICIVKCFER